MLTSLRSRLFLSYVTVIVAALLVVALALFGFAVFSTTRYLPTLQRLAAVGNSNQSDLRRLNEAGASAAALQRFLDESAAEQNVRILAADRLTRRVIYDSEPNASWMGVLLTNVNRPRSLLLDFDADSVFGRFQHPNGGRWLVYAPPTPFSRTLVFYAQREPTPRLFFRAYFFRPLVGAGALALLLAGLLAVVIARSVARPLQRMALAAVAIAQGDYDQQLAPDGPREVQRLATSFNSMAAQVQQTQQAQREFVANISHDLKTPITSIQGWSQALLDGTAVSTQEQQQAVGVIHAEAERMARMVQQLLDLARIESDQLQLAREQVDLHALLQTVVHNLTPRAQAQQIALALETVPTPLMMGDTDRLTQIFTNLLDNALAYTPAGETVHVALSRPGAGEVAVRVEDRGPGIPAAELSRIFERFYQVDKSRSRSAVERGAGLGLAIVQELVAAHDGRITVDSTEGEGSTFTVFLPTAPGESV